MNPVRLLVLAAVLAVAALVAVAVAQLAAGDRDGRGSAGGPRPSPTPEAAPDEGQRAEDPPRVALELVADGISEPVYVAAAPEGDGRLFVVERSGRIRVIDDGVLAEAPFLDISDQVSVGGERGLLSMAFHPEFAENGRFYVDYTDGAGDTRVSEFLVPQGGERADRSSERRLLHVEQPYSNHNGGQLQVGPDGRLYVGMGDGGSAGDPHDHAQDDGSQLGKLLRLALDGEPAAWETYAKGLRNPWRFSFDRETGDLWIGDVGQNGVEEIDLLPAGSEAGANLGWSGFEGSQVYDGGRAAELDRGRLVWPADEYGHDLGRSVTGGYVYRGTAVDGLQGWYLFGDYLSGRVWALDTRDGERVRLEGADGAVEALVSFGEDAAGELYVVSLAGRVFRIVPAV
jgi:glucose/arabinose dehydrogenase